MMPVTGVCSRRDDGETDHSGTIALICQRACFCQQEFLLTDASGKEKQQMNKDSLAFVVYMIHKCANQWKMTPSSVYQILDDSGCIQTYLVPHYEVLHTQSSQYVMDDIQMYLRQRGIAV